MYPIPAEKLQLPSLYPTLKLAPIPDALPKAMDGLILIFQSPIGMLNDGKNAPTKPAAATVSSEPVLQTSEGAMP